MQVNTPNIHVKTGKMPHNHTKTIIFRNYLSSLNTPAAPFLPQSERRQPDNLKYK